MRPGASISVPHPGHTFTVTALWSRTAMADRPRDTRSPYASSGHLILLAWSSTAIAQIQSGPSGSISNSGVLNGQCPWQRATAAV